jgi:hypothetical protein
MNITLFSRIYLVYLLYNTGGWIYFVYLTNYTNYITNDNCNDYSKDLTNLIRIFLGLSMGLTSFNILIATSIIINHENNNFVKVDTFNCILFTSILFLSVSGISGFILFCETSAMTNIQCSNYEAEFGIKIAVYGVIWIAFIEMFFIFLIIMNLLYNIILNARLHLLCETCIDICKKYSERRIAIEPSIPKYNTNQISIPIDSLKEDNKILCSICYDATINLLLEPCNHICICELCYNSLFTKECPICKMNISATKKIFFISPNSHT